MVTIRAETHVDAPTERVFDLARSIDLQHETSSEGTRPVAGAVSGLATPGESTVWQVPLLGKRFELTTKVSAFSRPNHFRQTMKEGPLDTFVHDHFFAFEDEDAVDGTMLRDVVTFASPLGPVGRVFDRAVERRFTRVLRERNEFIKRVAEGDEWRRYIEE
ncbi:SRPBCC family protein [Halomarina salina]|uniref:SRPBCC family protein n=1 Tax=Halomarina salina TaxID=1872699 RepID=A0ABD5RKX0_9EURY|nr:SRPBCC family protein [Halomarina salina]